MDLFGAYNARSDKGAGGGPELAGRSADAGPVVTEPADTEPADHPGDVATPPPPPPPPPAPVPVPLPLQRGALVTEQDERPEPTASRVRPYTRTGGRTRADFALNLETLISRSPGDAPAGSPEMAAVRDACRSARSVAEIAVHLEVPIGVARVVISDAIHAGLVQLTVPASPDEPSLDLLERVLEGLRRI